MTTLQLASITHEILIVHEKMDHELYNLLGTVWSSLFLYYKFVTHVVCKGNHLIGVPMMSRLTLTFISLIWQWYDLTL